MISVIRRSFVHVRLPIGERYFCKRQAKGWCGAMTKNTAGIVWYRRDLRVSDHEALSSAAQNDVLAPVYCLDAGELAATMHPSDLPVALPTMGPYRAR